MHATRNKQQQATRSDNTRHQQGALKKNKIKATRLAVYTFFGQPFAAARCTFKKIFAWCF
jgi:hypothetical protein